MNSFDYKALLGYQSKKTVKFSEFVEGFLESPENYLQTSSTCISESIKYFGFEIVIRSGEPIISYNVFKDLFSNGINAVFGQEFCIKQIMNVVESADKEVGPNRGVVLVGPPASGKTNIVDLIAQALEEYTQHETIKLYSFYFQFSSDSGRVVEIRSAFRHSPLLLFPLILQKEEGGFTCPRRELFEQINKGRSEYKKILIPSHYLNASLDRRHLDIIEALIQNPRNKGKSLFDILEEVVRVEELEFSNAQAKGISNIDDLRLLKIHTHPIELVDEDRAILKEHLPGNTFYQYDGALVDSNRGILHIHDAFGSNGNGAGESDYKPLLMLLGSGKAAVESTQAPLDNTVILTTNIEEMALLEKQLTSSKLLDRIEKTPVNYLLDTNSEMDILKRDMSNMREKFDFDPNLLRIAAYYSVMTRLLPPIKKKLPETWSDEKKAVYYSILPEQKLFIYSSQAEDPVGTIQRLPHWHPFRNEAMRLGLKLYDAESYTPHIVQHPNAVNLRSTGLFTDAHLKLIDDEFMRELWNEHYPNEGKHGISIRQLQNIMRNTIANSDGRKIHVGIFLSQLKRLIAEGPELHHWLAIDPQYSNKTSHIPSRKIGTITLAEGEGDFGDFQGLVQAVKGLYYSLIINEITICTVDRDPKRIEMDLRRYMQHALLARAIHNKAFAHIMVPKFTFIDPASGKKVEDPDLNYMLSLEKILCSDSNYQLFRQEIAEKFLDLQSAGELVLETGKNLISSKDDIFLSCFAKEHALLLSHRRVDENINPELLKNAFFHKRNDPQQYEHHTPEIRKFAEAILTNMSQRFSYSREIALDTIVFALRKHIVDFHKILS
ncbi:MAG: hypothetical protein HQM14_11725 [SAR324 cluster bacterium]|nr:hypothetical protein [SAR324 cluster bacterium]